MTVENASDFEDGETIVMIIDIDKMKITWKRNGALIVSQKFEKIGDLSIKWVPCINLSEYYSVKLY